MEVMIGLAAILGTFALLFVARFAREKLQDARTKKISQKHKMTLQAACLCPNCQGNVASAINDKLQGRGRYTVYEDLQMTCPFCEAVVTWDVIGSPPVAKQTVLKQKRGEEEDPDKSQHRSKALRASSH